MRSQLIALAGVAVLVTPFARSRHADVPLATLDLAKMRVQAGGGRGGQQTVAQANKSIDGNPIRIGGKVFTEGVGTRTTSVLFVKLGGGADRFSTLTTDSPHGKSSAADGKDRAKLRTTSHASVADRRGTA